MNSRDPLWYKDAIIYQAHVRAFVDSSNDGVGDFRGLTEKLDYVERPEWVGFPTTGILELLGIA